MNTVFFSFCVSSKTEFHEKNYLGQTDYRDSSKHTEKLKKLPTKEEASLQQQQNNNKIIKLYFRLGNKS